MPKRSYAEDANYWKTSRSSDQALRTAEKEIKAVGGQVRAKAFARRDGRSAWMMEFVINGVTYRSIWPVLKSRTGNEKAAEIQAAVAMKHDIKAKCVAVKWLGAEQAFARERLLPNGRTVGEASSPELEEMLPRLLTGGENRRN